MTVSSKIAFAASISWLSRASVIGANLILLPVLFRLLGKEELGIWMILGNSSSFLGFLGLGIAPTLTRHIALAVGKGSPLSGSALTDDNRQHVADLVESGKIILRCLAILVFFISLASGYGLISQIDPKEVSSETVFISWIFICVGYSLSVWVSYLNCWLTGIGYVGWEQLATTVVSLLSIFINILVVSLGGGIQALAVVLMLSAIVQRLALIIFLRCRQPNLLNLKGNWNYQYVKKMIQPSLYCWLTSLGAFLILRTDTYFIAVLKGAENVPNYQAGYQLVSNLWQLAITFGTVSSTFISQSWQSGDVRAVHKIVFRNVKLGLSIMAVGVAFLLTYGEEITILWLGEGSFVGYDILAVFCIMLTLQAQRGILVTSSRATEDENYAFINLTAGALNFIFTWLLIGPLGLFGVSLGTLLAQIMTNSWYGVLRPVRRLKLKLSDYFNQVMVLWFCVFSVCFLSLWTSKIVLVMLNVPEIFILLSAALMCSFIFLVFTWNYTLKTNERTVLKSKFMIISKAS